LAATYAAAAPSLKEERMLERLTITPEPCRSIISADHLARKAGAVRQTRSVRSQVEMSVSRIV
jgi:hypothetical protein